MRRRSARAVLSSFRYVVERSIAQRAHAVRRFVGRNLVTIDEACLDRALSKLIESKRQCLMMHSSLAACGFIVGGDRTIVECVHKLAATICLPTHSYCYPSSVAEIGPVFHPRSTESQVGRITNWFRRQPDVARSIHPTHSLAAHGPEAQEVCAGHEKCETPCGTETPYGWLVKKDAGVLMFGASMDTYTLFHTAEHEAKCSYLYDDRVWRLRACDYDGVVHNIGMLRQNMSVPRRFAAMDVILEREGLLRRQRLGVGQLLYIESSKALHVFLVDQLRRDPLYLTHESFRGGRA